jgi:ASC-1-like (ASCH) protein
MHGFNPQEVAQMSLQDIQIANNQRKRLLKAIADEDILQQDEDVLVLSVAAYKSYKDMTGESPIEDIISDAKLDYSAEYIIFN